MLFGTTVDMEPASVHPNCSHSGWLVGTTHSHFPLEDSFQHVPSEQQFHITASILREF